MVVFCTAPEDRAPAIARVLVDRHLAACVNVAAVRSFYRWEGEYVEDTEALLIIKTTRRRLEEAVTAIRDLHPYSLPEMIALPVAAGYFPYLSWVREETGI
jgi:periplasmic divalent cation tolerance protein